MNHNKKNQEQSLIIDTANNVHEHTVRNIEQKLLVNAV
jgi:hypothetical protein